jgi:pimeloyl-ACP methyl ester carboxylesterase
MGLSAATSAKESIMRVHRVIGLLIVLALLAVPAASFAQDEGSTTAAYEALVGAEPMYGVVEEIVGIDRDGLNMVGTLALPEGGEGPFPIVLLFHGFLGERDELPIVGIESMEGMYTRTARALAGQGIASLRIEFIGSGESDGDWADTTFTSQINDAIAAIDYIETLDTIDAERIGLIGLSQGGLVAASVAGRDPRVDSVVLWSASASPSADFPGLIGEDIFMEGLTNPEGVIFTLPWGEETTLRQPFFLDVFNVDPVLELSRFDGPVMAIGGLRDTTVYPQPYMSQLYLNNHDGPEMLVAVDGDHVFDVLVPEAGASVIDEVIAWSLAWLTQTL